ncbi:MAG TPA: hypothetical protein PKC62_03415, partial [Ferruginibacter sp.]|nr:hypothetical protein [Ferruginibacter sp.]
MDTAKKMNIVISGGSATFKKQVQLLLAKSKLPLHKIVLAPSLFRVSKSKIPRPGIFILFLDTLNKQKLLALSEFSKKIPADPILIIADNITAAMHQKLLKANATDSLSTASLSPYILEKTIMGAIRLKSLSNELQFSNERYYLVGQATNDMVWDWDLLNNRVFRSKEAWQKITGSRLTGEHNQPDSWWNRIHPGDKEKVKKIIQDILKRPDIKKFQFECRVLR